MNAIDEYRETSSTGAVNTFDDAPYSLVVGLILAVAVIGAFVFLVVVGAAGAAGGCGGG
jgi:hypothetical protein